MLAENCFTSLSGIVHEYGDISEKKGMYQFNCTARLEVDWESVSRFR